MKKPLSTHTRTLSVLFASLFATSANAAILQFDISSTVSAVDGSYIGGVFVGDTITGTFIVDDDKNNGDLSSDPGPGTNPGHEYTSLWSFGGSQYSVDLQNVTQAGSYSSDTQAIVVNDGLFLTSEATGGLLPTGTFDWIEILGANTTDYCPPAVDCVANPNEVLVADGEEWTLAIFSTDAAGNPDDNWFIGGDIPQNLPTHYFAFLIGLEFNAVGEETGLVLAPLDSMTVSAVPVPAAVWLFGSGIIGLAGFARRNS